MRSAIIVSALAALATAAPLAKRQSNSTSSSSDIDPTILNFALTLEHLEAAFYKQYLDKYDASAFASAGYPQWVRKRVTEIASHEDNHVKFLTSALSAAGATPVQACSYEFGVDSVAAFLATAQVLEGVGVAAYLGAAPLVTSKAYLSAAGSILTVEARHNAWLRSAVNKGDAFPAPYETALDPMEVFSLAAAFITSCPDGSNLPFKAFPALAGPATASNGESIKLTTSASGAKYAVFLSGNGQYPVAYSADGVKVPDEVSGQVYVILTNAEGTVTDEITVAGPAIVEVPISPSKVFSY